MIKEEINKISNHITAYSLNILAKSIIDSTFSEHYNEFSHSMALVGTIQMLELYLKSKIFAEDYSLIFNKKDNVDFFNEKTINIYDSINIFKKLFNININKKEIEKIIKKRNQLVHFGLNDHEYYYTSKIVLKFIFNVIIPILENHYKDDLQYLFNCLGNRDDCIFEDYIIELLDQYGIKYSNSIKDTFTYQK